jgi:hypothetical protein
MIIKTTSPDQLRTVIAGLKKAGITQVTNDIMPMIFDYEDRENVTVIKLTK